MTITNQKILEQYYVDAEQKFLNFLNHLYSTPKHNDIADLKKAIPPSNLDMTLLMQNPYFVNPLIWFSKFNIIQVAEIYKRIAALNNQKIDYIFSGFMDLSSLKNERLHNCREATLKAGIIMGPLDAIEEIKEFDGKVLDVVKNEQVQPDKCLAGGESILCRRASMVIPATITFENPSDIVGRNVNYINLSYFRNHFVSTPENQYWPSSAIDEVKAHIDLEKYMLSTPLFQLDNNFLSPAVQNQIQHFIYTLCLISAMNLYHNALTAIDVNSFFKSLYGEELGLNTDDESYNKRLSLNSNYNKI